MGCRLMANKPVLSRFLLVAVFAASISVLNPVVAGASDSQTVEVGFSPEGSAERIVEKVIDSAQHSIRVAAYSFTSPEVVRGLINAKRRGVDVAVVVDAKANVAEGSKGAQALSALVTAGIPVRVVSVYPIHHDKFVVTDGANVQTGSFNYSRAAAERNSENVIYIRNNQAVASQYLAHWQDRWAKGQAFRPRY